METIVIQNKTSTGDILKATFLPEKGMNMISFKRGDIEVIDQSTKEQFEERYAGLGAMIGPHFHRKKDGAVPLIKDESLFPHIARVKSKGIHDPFSHGIGRYAPWKAEASPTKINAVLTGKDTWNGIPLSQLEGQNFKMMYTAEMTPSGLMIDISVVSDTDSIVGIHFYYHLPNGKGIVTSNVQDTFIENNQREKIPDSWDFSDQHRLKFNLTEPANYTFYPHPNPREGHITLETETYKLITRYNCVSQENSWQLYHPKDASFVCIEPLSAQDPRHPNLTVSSLRIHLDINFSS